jgi:hypothetical protein
MGQNVNKEKYAKKDVVSLVKKISRDVVTDLIVLFHMRKVFLTYCDELLEWMIIMTNRQGEIEMFLGPLP